jgi:DNA polymerase elongation subunit (family B)
VNRIVIDVETVGLPWETWDEKTQEYLVRRGGSDSEEEAVKERLGLSAMTGKVIAIGMMNPDNRRGGVYYEIPNAETEVEEVEGEGVTFRGGSEEEILRSFWNDVKRYDLWVTFNGRTFDIPFLMQRSLILGIKPSKNLDSARFRVKPHCDLMDILSFFGATRPYSLSFWCTTLGIQDPKEEGIEGSMIGDLYHDGKHMEIARYCLRDVVATVELFLLVEDRYLSLRTDWR